MTASDKRAQLEAEKAQLSLMLGSYTESEFLQRMGFEQRIAAVTQELAELSTRAERGTRAETDLTFYGGPVVGSDGIEADFAAKVIAAFQDLVNGTSAARDALPTAVRDAQLSRMHLTGVIHGSFGFQLRELSDAPGEIESPLFTAVEGAARLIDAAGRDDETFSDAVQEMNPLVRDAVRVFFTTIRSAQATFRLSSTRLRTEFTSDRINAAVERVTATNYVDTIDDFQGVFFGALHGSRRFEFQLRSGQVITGKVSTDVPLASLDQWTTRGCISTITTRAWQRGGRVYRRYYTLHGLAPDPTLPSPIGSVANTANPSDSDTND